MRFHGTQHQMPLACGNAQKETQCPNGFTQRKRRGNGSNSRLRGGLAAYAGSRRTSCTRKPGPRPEAGSTVTR